MSAPVRIPIILTIAAGSLLAALGCGSLGVSNSSGLGDDFSPPGLGKTEDGGAGTGTYVADASMTPAQDAGTARYKGNPLCLTPSDSYNVCDPQLENTPGEKEAGTAESQCQTLLDQDAGEYACHVTKQPNGTVAPTCTPAGSSTGACSSPSACKAGYECVGEQAGECRHYCCDPTACEPSSFCDVQPIFTNAVKVPVCMPIQSCDLLGPCRDATQQCGIVDQTKGTTSCLDIGPRLEGDECETDHCAKDLVCLGSLGSRKCFQLCDTKSASSCAMGQRCLTNSVTFKGSNVGICGQ